MSIFGTLYFRLRCFYVLVILNVGLLQFAVFYLDEECLGGARICDVGPSMHECPSRGSVELATFRSNREEWNEFVEQFEDISDFEQWDITGYNTFKIRSAVR